MRIDASPDFDTNGTIFVGFFALTGILFLFWGCSPGSSREDLRVESLGSVPIREGTSAPLNLEVREGESIAVQLRGNADEIFFIRGMSGPGGVWVSDEYGAHVLESTRRVLDRYGPLRTSRNPVVPTLGHHLSVFPNGDVPLPPGRYSFVIGAADAVGRSIDTRACVRVSRRSPSVRGRVDLTVHLSGALGWTAENVESSVLPAVFEDVREIYRAANIEIGEPTYVDLAAGYQRLENIEGPGDYREMLAHARRGLNVFVIESFVGGTTSELRGISDGVPGGAWLFEESDPDCSEGTASGSGVVVALNAHRPNEDGFRERTARTVAHELAHWLGLFHTSEGGVLEDPLEDTPSGPEAMRNLLYPDIDGGIELTAGQARILRQHPAIIAID